MWEKRVTIGAAARWLQHTDGPPDVLLQRRQLFCVVARTVLVHVVEAHIALYLGAVACEAL